VVVFGLLSILATSSGGGSSSAPPAPSSPPSAPSLNLDFGIKQLQFSWAMANGADFYRLFENPDGVSGFTQVGADLPAATTSTTIEIAVHRHNWAAARYLLEACNSFGCTASNEVFTLSGMLQTIGYFKASNTDAGDFFGVSVALSPDGKTLAVGAHGEDSAATDINGNQNDDSAPESGAVYVYTSSGATWSQQAYIKASNTEAGDHFGHAVALSADGNTLAVGANAEDSSATGINGNQNDDSAAVAGAVYVFTRSGGTWSQQAYIKASNTGADDTFGNFGSVALSADGNTLAVGAVGEAGAATGINGNQADNSAPFAGAVYVYTRSGAIWSQQAYVKASNTGADDRFGRRLTLSDDGNTLAVGAPLEDSATTGIDGNQNDESATDAGAVYLFTRSSGTWSQQAYVKASNTGAGDLFGDSVSLSADGNTLAVGAFLEDSATLGINGNQNDESATDAGAVYVYTRSGATWSQQAYLKASNTGANDQFGISVALSDDGNTLAVGDWGEESAATGIDGNQTGNSAPDAGAVHVFTRSGATWAQQAYVKASNTGADDRFGGFVSLSADGNTLAARAIGEASAATGINGNQTDNSVVNAGALYLY
jgi:hypothetical protein